VILFFQTDGVGKFRNVIERGGKVSSQKVNWIKMEMFEVRDLVTYLVWRVVQQPTTSQPLPMLKSAASLSG
jgi:hypothetical protein